MPGKTDLEKKYFDINAYAFIEKLRLQIHRKVIQILKMYDRLDLKDIVYTCVKELVINGTKAMVKRIVFAENNLDIDDPDDWEKGTAIFKNKLRESYIEEFAKKTKSLNFKVKIRYIYNVKGMRVEVINNTPIPRIDEKRMRGKLSKAMRYNSIGDYYMDNADDIEGVGMGLAFIVILLKNQGLDPQYLRIGTIGDQTIARVEFPFKEDYIPYRDIKYKEKLIKDTSH